MKEDKARGGGGKEGYIYIGGGTDNILGGGHFA